MHRLINYYILTTPQLHLLKSYHPPLPQHYKTTNKRTNNTTTNDVRYFDIVDPDVKVVTLRRDNWGGSFGFGFRDADADTMAADPHGDARGAHETAHVISKVVPGSAADGRIEVIDSHSVLYH
jgi:hypothetical protein